MASIRKRVLPSAKVVWLVDYKDGQGKRRHRQFPTKREADLFLVKARAEVAAGTHTPDSASITVYPKPPISGWRVASAIVLKPRRFVNIGRTLTFISRRASATQNYPVCRRRR